MFYFRELSVLLFMVLGVAVSWASDTGLCAVSGFGWLLASAIDVSGESYSKGQLKVTGAWWRMLDTDLFGVFADKDDERRELSAAVLGALLLASSRGPMWTLSDIRGLLFEVGYVDPVGNEALSDVVERLTDTGYVTRFRNYSAPVGSYADGGRRREAWSLTREGRVMVAAVREAVGRLDRTLQLPPRLLDAVEQTLRGLLLHFREDAGMLAPALAQVNAHLEQLQEAGGDFYSAVGTLAQHDVSNDAVFATSREHILLALRQFARRTEQSLGRVRSAFDELNAVGVASVVRRALPGAGILEPEAQDSWAAARERELGDLQAWFTPRGSIERLVDAAADAIHALLGAIDRRYYATTRGSDVGADFRQIARMLHAQPTTAATYEVFAAAFGMWPARHALAPDEEDIAVHNTASAGACHEVKVVLRSTERGAKSTGRPRKIPDLGLERRQGEAQNDAELDRLEAIARDLATPGPVPLSFFKGLAADHTAVLIGLLEEALNGFDDSAGCGSTYTVGAALTLWPGDPEQTVTVEFADGTLTAPDVLIEVSLLDYKEGTVA
ncbi:DUF2397 family protein [Kitasatospora sp. NPDC059327]|uniref:DUF2397 family protein n=1 Tax=Kitasatospora sp. NPDC059327 TaxID=3346803 RepID=UPI0036C7DD96